MSIWSRFSPESEAVLWTPNGSRFEPRLVPRSEDLREPPGLVVDGSLSIPNPYLPDVNKSHQIVQLLFGTDDATYVGGATSHPDFPLLPGEKAYPTDQRAAEAVYQVLLAGREIKSPEEYIPLKTPGSVITCGSPAALPLNRRYMGTPDSPQFNLQLRTYTTTLKYNYIVPDRQAPKVLNWQQDRIEPWSEQNQGIAVSNGHIWFPRIDRKGWLLCDYLLVTRLPGGILGAGDIIIFGGTHGAGTQATELLLRDLPLDELNKLLSQLDDLNRSRYYQALFLVENVTHEGHSFGKHLKFLDAELLSIKWNRNAVRRNEQPTGVKVSVPYGIPKKASRDQVPQSGRDLPDVIYSWTPEGYRRIHSAADDEVLQLAQDSDIGLLVGKSARDCYLYVGGQQVQPNPEPLKIRLLAYLLVKAAENKDNIQYIDIITLKEAVWDAGQRQNPVTMNAIQVAVSKLKQCLRLEKALRTIEVQEDTLVLHPRGFRQFHLLASDAKDPWSRVRTRSSKVN